ncbi:alpha amylase N-terminal ig-like domain-containing protein [Bacillus mycoides]|uniref:alpha amylase N-terminal ig-like domain-containing protein n=1 Tax=Bacillus mycoides TaxID=1405 RepID=UPI0011A9D0EF
MEGKFKGLGYGFEVKNDTERMIYREGGYLEERGNDDVGNFFCLGFSHEEDVFKGG